MKSEGYKEFKIDAHTNLWKSLKAKDPKKQYGVKLSDGQWYWYESWVVKVREHCSEKWPQQ